MSVKQEINHDEQQSNNNQEKNKTQEHINTNKYDVDIQSNNKSILQKINSQFMRDYSRNVISSNSNDDFNQINSIQYDNINQFAGINDIKNKSNLKYESTKLKELNPQYNSKEYISKCINKTLNHNQNNHKSVNPNSKISQGKSINKIQNLIQKNPQLLEEHQFIDKDFEQFLINNGFQFNQNQSFFSKDQQKLFQSGQKKLFKLTEITQVKLGLSKQILDSQGKELIKIAMTLPNIKTYLPDVKDHQIGNSHLVNRDYLITIFQAFYPEQIKKLSEEINNVKINHHEKYQYGKNDGRKKTYSEIKELCKLVDTTNNVKSRMCMWRDKNNCKHVWNSMYGQNIQKNEGGTITNTDPSKKSVVQQFMELKNINNLQIDKSGNMQIDQKK